MLKKMITLIFLLGILLPMCLAQSKAPLPDAVMQSIKSRVDGGSNAGIVVGIVDSDGVRYYSYGVKSVNGNEKVDENSVFEIGSISKTFTGTILADMTLKGMANLEDPLQKYLPEGVKAPTRDGKAIKLVEMSNHTSALPRMPNNFNPANPLNPYIDYSEKQLYDFLSSYELSRDIGSTYEYSNYAYGQLKKEKSDQFNFDESELNDLGYYYMSNGEMEKAIAVLKVNVEAFPDAFNVYDSMGEAYMKSGDNEKAITNYKKSVELNPANTGGIAMLEKLGVDVKDLEKDVEVAEEILESYVGKYELMPGFIITITREENQLKAQATGQPQFEIYPKTENIFYLKVVQAQVTFNKNADGVVKSLTLLQGGQEIEGKRLD